MASSSRASSAESRRAMRVSAESKSLAPVILLPDTGTVSAEASTLSRTAPKRPALTLDDDVVPDDSPQPLPPSIPFSPKADASRSPRSVREARRALQGELDELRASETAKRRIEDAEIQYQLHKEATPPQTVTLHSPKFSRLGQQHEFLDNSEFRLSKDQTFFVQARQRLDAERSHKRQQPGTYRVQQPADPEISFPAKQAEVGAPAPAPASAAGAGIGNLVSATLAELREAAAVARVARAREISDRRRRHAQLENSVAKISRMLRAKNEKKSEIRAENDRKFKEQFAELKRKNVNPYEVFRQQEVEAKISEKIRTSEKLRVVRAEQLLEKLEYEKSLNDRKFLQRQQHEELERRHQAEISGQKRKGAIGNFIKRHTIDKISLIDAPGGKLVPSHFVRLPQPPLELPLQQPEAATAAAEQQPQGVAVPAAAPASALELRYRREALARQRAAVREGAVQRCCGVEFSGICFDANPRKIVFSDFTVGETLTKRLRLTNVSLTFAQFKILPIPVDRRELFQVRHVAEAPGRMSAGTAATLEISFTPKEDADVVTHLPLLTTTGEMQVPIECVQKKTVLEISCSEICFGDVVHGEEATRRLLVKNLGALSSEYTLEIPGISDSLRLVGGEQRGILDKLLEFEFEFKPSAVGERLDTTVSLVFDKETRNFQVSGRCVDVPLFLDNQQGFDIGHILAEKNFREEISVRNRGRTGLKVASAVIGNFPASVSVSPKEAVIQADSSLVFQISVKFPTDACGPFRVPVQFTSPGQRLPVDTEISGVVTDFRVELSPSCLDFGQVPVQTARKIPLVLKNTSALLQRFAISGLPEFFFVSGSPGTLLPHETREIFVSFAPTMVGPSVNTEISLKVVTGEALAAAEYKVRLRAEISRALVKLDATSLKFRAAPAAVALSSAVEITGRAEPTTVKIEGPGNFRFHPNFFLLPPRTTQRVQVDWVGAGEISGEISRFSVSCKTSQTTQVLWVACEAWKLENSEISVQPGVLDFGPVLVGDRKLLTLQLQEISGQPLAMSLPVAENKNFQVLSSVARSFPQPRAVTVAFAPDAKQNFRSELEIVSATGIAQVQLRGAGVVPCLNLSEIFFEFPGICADGVGVVQKTLILKNESADCHAEFSFEFDAKAKYPREAASEFFFARPHRGAVAPNSSLEVQLVFRPEIACDVFVQRALLRVQGLANAFELWLRGKSPQRQLYALRQASAETEATVPFFKSEADSRLLERNGDFLLETGQKERWSVGMSAAKDAKNKAETSGTVEIVWDQTNPVCKWLVKTEPSNKFPVPAGTEVAVAFELGVPPPKKKGETATEQSVTLKGKVVFSGGFVPAGEAASKEIPIEVRATVTN